MLNCRSCVNGSFRKIHLVTLQHVHFPDLDYSICTVLAAGHIGTHLLPNYLGHHASIPATGYCGGRRVSTFEIDHFVAFANVATQMKKVTGYFS